MEHRSNNNNNEGTVSEFDEVKISDRKKAFLEDMKRRNSSNSVTALERSLADLSEHLDETSLSDRKKAFFEDVTKRNQSSASSRNHSVKGEGDDDAFIEVSISLQRQDYLIGVSGHDRGGVKMSQSSTSSLQSENGVDADGSENDETATLREMASLEDRKKAFYEDLNEREKLIERTETKDDIDGAEIAFRRQSFRKRERDVDVIRKKEQVVLKKQLQQKRQEKEKRKQQEQQKLLVLQQQQQQQQQQHEQQVEQHVQQKRSPEDEECEDPGTFSKTLKDRKSAFLRDLNEKETYNKNTASATLTEETKEIAVTLADRKKAFYDDLDVREKSIVKTETSTEIDPDEVAFRRQSFRKREKEVLEKSP